ncbi:MAG: hypothetical protein HFJ41_04115 [Clostridia bacterium]|nr:hypothetical protein [Clostridia bacterium]
MKMPKQYIFKTESNYPMTIKETCNANLKDGYKLVDIFPCKSLNKMTLIFVKDSTMDNLPKNYEVLEAVDIPNNIENFCNIELKDNSILITSFASLEYGIINLVFAQY